MNKKTIRKENLKEFARDPINSFFWSFSQFNRCLQCIKLHELSMGNEWKTIIKYSFQMHFKIILFIFYHRKSAFYLQVYLKMNIMENKVFVAGKWIEMEKLYKLLNLLLIFGFLKLNEKTFGTCFEDGNGKFPIFFTKVSINTHTGIDLNPTMGALIDSI